MKGHHVIEVDPDNDFISNVDIVKAKSSELLTEGVIPLLRVMPSASQKWNMWVRRYAAANGLPLIDEAAGGLHV